jgi:hypothetical protein
MRRLLMVVAIAAVLLLSLAVPAQALRVTGGTAAQRQQVIYTLYSRPNLLAYVEAQWPDFLVRINYGGHAWNGYIDVNVTRSGKAFTDMVAHEFSHEVHLASTAKGDSLSAPWLSLLRSKGYTSYIYGVAAPLYGVKCPVECLAENMAHTLYPAYMLTTVPNTQLVKLTYSQMVAFLTANGIKP